MIRLSRNKLFVKFAGLKLRNKATLFPNLIAKGLGVTENAQIAFLKVLKFYSKELRKFFLVSGTFTFYHNYYKL